MYWVADEANRTAEKIKTYLPELPTIASNTGSSGSIVKDLTPTGGVPVKLEGVKAGFYVPTEALGASEVKVSTLPELPTGTKGIGSVKVSDLEGDPEVKASGVGEAPAKSKSTNPTSRSSKSFRPTRLRLRTSPKRQAKITAKPCGSLQEP